MGIWDGIRDAFGNLVRTKREKPAPKDETPEPQTYDAFGAPISNPPEDA